MPNLRPLLAVGALAALTLTLNARTAHAQRVEFRGGGYLTDFSTACAQSGWTDFAYFTARFRPANTEGNGTINRLTAFFNTYAYNLSFPEVGVGQTVQATRWAAIGSGSDLNFGPTPAVRRLAPPAFTAFGDNELHFVGEIDNFDFTQGCTARASIFLVRHQ